MSPRIVGNHKQLIFKSANGTEVKVVIKEYVKSAKHKDTNEKSDNNLTNKEYSSDDMPKLLIIEPESSGSVHSDNENQNVFCLVPPQWKLLRVQ
jgi:hypothetical protein